MELEIGAIPVPGYKLVQLLGQGAFGEVWEARRDDALRVAMKFLDCRARSASQVANEVRIFRALSELNHPHLLPLLGVHASSKYLILIMQRADCSLADLHQAYLEDNQQHIPPEHALHLLEQAAVGLDFLAQIRLPGLGCAQGLQHCDVKPTNLLMVGNRLKVADFGLCGGAGWYGHTGWKGTLPYAAPELFNGAASKGTDQFALAITFCELVMGDRPFWKGDPAERSAPGSPIDLTQLREAEFPVLARAVHPYPSSRWPTCREFIVALRKAGATERQRASVRIFPRGLHGSLGRSRASAEPPVPIKG